MVTHVRGNAPNAADLAKEQDKQNLLQHTFELSRIRAIWEEKERKVLARMQVDFEAGVERTLTTAAHAMEVEEISKAMQIDAEVDRLQLLKHRGGAVLTATRSAAELQHHKSQRPVVLSQTRKAPATVGGWQPDPDQHNAAGRAKAQHAAQHALRLATASKELATRQRMEQLKADAHHRQYEKQKVVRQKALHTALRDQQRLERMAQERQRRTEEQAARSRTAATRLALLVETQTRHTEQRRKAANDKAILQQEQQIVTTWIEEMIALERKEAAQAQAAKVQRAQAAVKQQEEEKHRGYVQRQAYLTARQQRRDKVDRAAKKLKSKALQQRQDHQHQVAQRVAEMVHQKRRAVMENQAEKERSSARVLQQQRHLLLERRRTRSKAQHLRLTAGRARLTARQEGTQRRRAEEREDREQRYHDRQLQQDRARQKERARKEQARTRAYERVVQKKKAQTLLMLAKMEGADQHHRKEGGVQVPASLPRITYPTVQTRGGQRRTQDTVASVDHLVALQKRQLLVVVEEEEEAERQRMFLFKGVAAVERDRAAKHHAQQRKEAVGRITRLTEDHRMAFLHRLEKVGMTEWGWRRRMLVSAGSIGSNGSGGSNAMSEGPLVNNEQWPPQLEVLGFERGKSRGSVGSGRGSSRGGGAGSYASDSEYSRPETNGSGRSGSRSGSRKGARSRSGSRSSARLRPMSQEQERRRMPSRGGTGSRGSIRPNSSQRGLRPLSRASRPGSSLPESRQSVSSEVLNFDG